MSTIGFAIIGAGNIGKIHAQALQCIPDTRVRVVCDADAQRGSALAESCGADWTSDFCSAVTRADVNAVCVCTPSGSHAEVVEAAAGAGKHLAVEKPIEVTLERADRIIDAAHKAGILMTCIFPSRFREGVHQTKRAVEMGRMGRLTLADAYVKWYRTQAYYQGTWRGTWALDGGGALINQSIHTVDLLQWLAGPVDTVFGRTATLAHRIETEDTACAVLVFHSGALGVIQGATSCWPGDRARLELHGDKGSIVLEEGRITTWKLEDAPPDEEERMLNLEGTLGSGSSDPTAIGYEMHRRQLADLVEAIQQGRWPVIEGAEARKSVEIILSIYRSAQTGRPVSLPLS